MSVFIDSLLDLLEPLGGVSARRMFGGYGLYKEGLMFGLVAKERLYLKTDDQSVDEFLQKGCEPFTFIDGKGRSTQMKYYEAPEQAWMNSQKMKPWAMLAWQAALRAPAKKPRKRSSRLQK